MQPSHTPSMENDTSPSSQPLTSSSSSASQISSPSPTPSTKVTQPDASGSSIKSWILSKMKTETLDLKGSHERDAVESLLIECGAFGSYQKRIIAIFILFFFLSPLQTMSMVFIGENVPFICNPPKLNVSLIPANISTDNFTSRLVPQGEQCSLYELKEQDDYYEIPEMNSTKVPCSEDRKFHTERVSTVVSEFNLVCERQWLMTVSKSVYFGGRQVGAAVFGHLADRFGRHHCFFVGLSIMVACGIVNIFSNSFILFIVLYFFQGFGQIGSYFCAYTTVIELVSTYFRTPLNFFVHILYGLGAMSLAAVAYLLPNWRHIEAAICIPFMVYALTWKCIPESPRWLIGRRKFREVEELLKKIAETNGVDFSAVKEKLDVMSNEEPGEKPKTYTVMDLIKNPILLLISLNIWCNWFANSMLYYGVTLNSVDMAGDPYINFLLMEAVEIPANFVCFWCFHKFGHLKPISFFMVFGGINCIMSNFIGQGTTWLPLTLAVLGKFGNVAAYSGIYLVSVEVFPTVVRNTGVGMASVCARVGGTLAPFVILLGIYVRWLPLTIFGTCSIVFGFLLLCLRDTTGINLPQTLEDMRLSYRKRRE